MQMQKGITALMSAAMIDSVDCVRVLLAAGADKDAKSKVYFSPYISDVLPCSCECVYLYVRVFPPLWQPISNMCEIQKIMYCDTYPQLGNTALMFAASKAQFKCLRLLVESGAALEIKNFVCRGYSNSSVRNRIVHHAAGSCIMLIS